MLYIEILKGINPETQVPAYYMQAGSYTKWLDPELVRSVVTSVLNQPATKAYTQQTAHLENFTKDRINPTTTLSLAAEEVNDILRILDTEIGELETKKPKNKRERNENEANLETKELIEEYILESRDKGIDDVTILTNLSAHNKEASYIQNAITKYAGVKSEKYVRDYTESSSKAVTNTQIEQLAADFNLDPATAKQQAASIRYNLRVIELLNKKREAAFKAMGVTPENYEAGLEEFFVSMKIGETSGQDITAAISDLGLLSNPTVGQARSWSNKNVNYKLSSKSKIW